MRSSAVAAAILTTLSLATPFAAQAGQKVVEHSKIVGYSAYGTWEYTAGNVATFVQVNVTENDLSGTAGKAQDAFVSLAISRSEIDTGNVLMTGSAYVFGPENFDFTVDHQLGTATLHVRDAIFQDDNSFTFFNVDLDLTWTATGDPDTMKSNDKYKEPGLIVHSTFQGTFRDAVATGSVYGKNIPTTAVNPPFIQFTPSASTAGQIQFNKFGSQTITTVTP